MASIVGSIVAGVVVVSVSLIIYFTVRDPKPKPSTEMTDADVALYRDAARLMARIVNRLDIDGFMSDDMLSDSSRKQIQTWLTAYKKELDRK